MSLPDAAVAIRPGEHACCRFATARDRRRAAASLVSAGLRRGHRVIYLWDAEDPASFVAELATADAAIEPALAAGQLSFLEAGETYLPNGRFEPESMLASVDDQRVRALRQGYSGLTLTGEVGAVGGAPGAESLREYERRLDERQTATSVLLCQYDHGRFDAGLLAEIARAHDVDLAPELAGVGREGRVAAARTRDGSLRLAGELDYDCAQSVADVLDAHFHGTLRFDLADLRFIDVAGMRALRGRKRQRVVITAASPPVHRLLAMLGWDTDDDIEVLDGG